MLDPQIIAKLKKDLKEINEIYIKIGKNPIKVDFSSENDLDTFKLIKMELAEAKTYVDDIEDGFASLTDSVVAITRDWSRGFASPTKEATKSMTKLKGLTEKLADDKNKIVRLSQKELDKIKQQAKAEKARLDDVKRRLQARINAGEILEGQEKSVFDNLKKGYQVQEDIIAGVKQRVKEEERITKLTGLTGQALEGASGILKKIGINISSDKFKQLSEGAREYAEELEEANRGLEETDPKFLDEAQIKAKVLGKTLTDSAKLFKDEMLLAFDVAIIKGFKQGLKTFGEQREGLANTFALGRKDADALKSSLNNIAINSKTTHFNIADAVKGLQDFNAEIGGAVKLTKEELQTFSLLSNEFGLTNEQASQFVASAKLRGKNTKELTEQMRGQVLILAEQEGIAVNQQKVFSNIGNISTANRLTMEGQGKSLANAAFQAAKLGMSQAQLEKTSSSLLDFESSIGAEMEAELMTGKQLNLEEARRAALMGNQEDLAKAISKEIGTSAEFGEYNILQQQSLAKAFGMSREELAETLQTQELLTGEAINMGQATEMFNKAMEDGVITTAEQQAIGEKSLVDQLAAEASSKRFANAMTKFKDQLVPIIEIFGKLLDRLMDVLEFFMKIKGVVTAIGKMVAIIAGIRMFGRLGGALKTLQKILGSMGSISKTAGKLPTALGGTSAAVTTAAKSGGGAIAKSTVKAASTAPIAKVVKAPIAKAGGGLWSKLNPLNAAKNYLGKNAPKFLKGAAKKIPLLGTAIEGIFAASDISNMVAGGGDPKQLNQMIGKRTAEALGSIGGMALGGFLGSFIPIPGVGTILGALAGDVAGRWAGGALAEAVGAEGLGAMVGSMFGGGGDTAEDFISRPGQPIQKFRADDVVMGSTSADGGSVAELLKELIVVVKQGGDVYIDGAKAGRSLALATSKIG